MLYQIWLPIYFSLVRYAITMAHWDLALKAVKIFKQPFCLHENGDAMGDNQMRWVCHGNFDWKVMVGYDCCFSGIMFSCAHPYLGACSIHSCGWVKATKATAEEFPDSCHWSPLRRQQIQVVSTLQHAKNHPIANGVRTDHGHWSDELSLRIKATKTHSERRTADVLLGSNDTWEAFVQAMWKPCVPGNDSRSHRKWQFILSFPKFSHGTLWFSIAMLVSRA